VSSRQEILKRISKTRAAAGISAHPADAFQRVPMRLQEVEDPDFDAVERFVGLATLQSMSVEEIESRQAAPAAIQRYLRVQSLQASVCVSPELQGKDINWSKAGFTVRTGAVLADGDTLVSECYGAIAEGGVLVVASSPRHHAEADFLAETHIVLLDKTQIVNSFEDLWEQWRADFGLANWPRAFCFIAGPSRTADLGLPLKLGAHGPARVHVLMVGA
jgi:L-lactate dehydrogenase complex protein LldG